MFLIDPDFFGTGPYVLGSATWVSGVDFLYCTLAPDPVFDGRIFEAIEYIGKTTDPLPWNNAINLPDTNGFQYHCLEPLPGRSVFVLQVPIDLTYQTNVVGAQAKFYIPPILGDPPYQSTVYATTKIVNDPSQALPSDYFGVFMQNVCPGECPQFQCVDDMSLFPNCPDT